MTAHKTSNQIECSEGHLPTSHPSLSLLHTLIQFTNFVHMTQVSPSSKKVDDFLSGLSQLSQNKIREDEQRQRELQRSIEELKRLNSTSPAKPDYDELTPVNSLMISDSVPTLKFSRSSGPTEYKSRLDIYEEENLSLIHI